MPATMTFTPNIPALPTGTYDTVIGAGGLLTGIMGSSDGTLLARLDTHTAHSLAPNATEWAIELLPEETIAEADIDLTYTTNIFGAAISWSNPAVRYLQTMGYVLVKKPGATTYTKTNMAQRSTMEANDTAHRMCGNPIDIHPTDPAICIAGFADGAFRTTNYGDNWTPISTSSLPAPTNSRHRYIIRWDRSTANRVWAFVPGHGLYRSDNAGVAWTKITDAPVFPTEASHMKVHPISGLVLLAGTNTDGIDAQVRRWNGSAWSVGTRTDGGGAANLFMVEFSAHHANRVYGMEGGGGYRVSADNGLTWDDKINPVTSADRSDIRWQAKEPGYLTASELIEHAVEDKLRFSCGIGCFEIRNPPGDTTGGQTLPIWGLSRGVENMVCTTAVIAPDGKRGLTMQDKQSMFFTPDAVGQVFPAVYGPVAGIGYGTGVDYAPEDTDFWVVSFIQLIPDDPTKKGLAWTPDRGKTWTLRTELPALTSGNGWGDVCVVTKDVWIAVQGIKGGYPLNSTKRTTNAVYITRDRGLTWTEVVIGNGNAVLGGQISQVPHKRFAKDYADPSAVYFYNGGDGENPGSADHLACVGIYKIKLNMADLAAAPVVTRQRTTKLYGFAREAYALKMVHGGAANTLLVCSGDDAVEGAFRSTNGGSDWTKMTGTDNLGIGTHFGEVYGFCAGAPHPSAPTVPTLWIVGHRISTADWQFDGKNFSKYGLWESRDNGLNWTRRQHFPGKEMMMPNDLAASMHRYGDLTLMLGGRGAKQILLSA